MKVKNIIFSFLFLKLLTVTPVADAQELRILPLGNSLTKGVYCLNGSIEYCETLPDSQVTGYRLLLYNSLIQAGYQFNFVGNEISGWSTFPDYNHAGYPGITSDNLATKINENDNYLLNSALPDIVLLEIGTNDVAGGSVSIEGVRSILNEIDEYEASSGKPVLIFLSKTIRFTQGTLNEGLVSTFNSNLLTLCNQRISSGDKIIWVDVGANLSNLKEPGGDMKDELHPNQGGYDKIAQVWFTAINSYNTAPVPAQIPVQTASEGSSFSAINLDNYIYDAEDADALISWTVQPVPQNLQVTIDANRQAIINPINTDWYGSEVITLVATDRGKSGIAGLRKSASIAVTCNVQPVNDPPVILSQTRFPSTVEEVPIDLSVSDLQVQDIDNPAGELTIQVLAGTNYSFSDNTIIPAPDFNGELIVGVRVNDLQSSSQSFNFKVNVSPKNDIPVIVSGNSLSYDEDMTFQLRLSDYQVNDPDNYFPADFTLIVSNGQHYNHSDNTITPEPNYYGIIQVPVSVRDLLDQSNEYMHSITILPVNDPPSLILPDALTFYEDQYNEIQLDASDPDEGDELHFSPLTLPSWLTFNTSTVSLQGTPAQQHIGENLVTMRVNDTHVNTDSTFTVMVYVKSGLPDDKNLTGDYLVFPNPASGFIHVARNIDRNQQVIFTLYSITGNQVLQEVVHQQQSLIRLDHYGLEPGLYLYEISEGTDTFGKGKLVIEPVTH